MCFLGKGKLVAAISCLKKANYLTPLDWKVLYNLSIVYSAMMQSASAYSFMSAALNLQPRNKTLLMGLAIILTDLGDVVNAKKAYKRALQLDNEDFILRLNFALFEYKQGNVDESVRLLEDAVPPKNIDESYLADLNLLSEQLKSSLRRRSSAAQLTS
ncbi:TPR-REGION domain-containing protein [Aphelenchoides fujianensis]|nr:TPR-REGION domain-containing protein [Aphelenchoides fujianensis]